MRYFPIFLFFFFNVAIVGTMPLLGKVDKWTNGHFTKFIKERAISHQVEIHVVRCENIRSPFWEANKQIMFTCQWPFQKFCRDYVFSHNQTQVEAAPGLKGLDTTSVVIKCTDRGILVIPWVVKQTKVIFDTETTIFALVLFFSHVLLIVFLFSVVMKKRGADDQEEEEEEEEEEHAPIFRARRYGRNSV